MDDLDQLSDESIQDSGNQFADIEKEFMRISNEMSEDPKMTRYLEAYTAMFDLAFNVHERAQELMRTRAQLKEDISTTERHLAEAAHVIEANAGLRDALEERVVCTHHLLDAAHAREQVAMEIIDNMKHTLSSLHAEIEFRGRMEAATCEDENPTVAKHRQGLEREREKLMTEVGHMNEKVEVAVRCQVELEEKSDMTDAQILELTTKLDEATTEVTKSLRVKERLKHDLVDITAVIEEANDELVALGEAAKIGDEIATQLTGTVHVKTAELAKCAADVLAYRQRHSDMQDECNRRDYVLGLQHAEYGELTKRLSLRTQELEKLRTDAVDQGLAMERAMRKKQQFDADAAREGGERSRMRMQVALLERDSNDQKVVIDVTRREFIGRQREKDIVRLNLKRQNAVGDENVAVIRLREAELAKQEERINEHLDNQREQRRHMKYLRRERDQLQHDMKEKDEQVTELIQDVRMRQHEMYSMRHLQHDSINRIRMQNNLYEAVCMENLTLAKLLHEQTGVTADLRAKVADYNTSNEMYRMAMIHKEQQLMQYSDENKLIRESTAAMLADLQANQTEIHEMREAIGQHKVFTKELLQQIEANDFRMRADDKIISTVMNETDLLGGQLVSRNEELMQLGKVTDLLEQMLAYGESRYRQRIEDIGVLKKEIARICQNKSVHSKDISNMNDFKAEALKLDKDLIRIRIKNKILSEEMRSPMNIHPWSKMEGSDPEKFQLMRRIFFKQKRVLTTAKHIQGRSMQLKEMTTLYSTLTHMLKKQPAKDFESRNHTNKVNLREGQAQTQHLTSAVKSVEETNSEIQLELQNAQLELRHERQKLLYEKKMRTKTVEKLRRLEQRTQEKLDQMSKMMSAQKLEEIIACIRHCSSIDLAAQL